LKETLSGSTYTQSVIGSGFRNPVAVAVDTAGNVYIADDYTAQVYKETLSGGTYTQSVILNSDLLNFFDTAGLAVDNQGDVYVVNASGGGGGTDANTVIKATPVGSGYVLEFVSTALQSPWAAAVDSHGNLYVTGSFNLVTEISFPPTGFGSVAVGTTSPVISFPFTTGTDLPDATSGATLSLGAPSEFTDVGTGTCDTNGTSHVYKAGETCTVDVTFTPKFAGLRRGAVEFINSSNVAAATAYISGTGLGPQAAFTPGTQSVVASGFTSPAGVAVDGNGTVYITDSGSGDKLYLETPSGSTYTQSTLGLAGAPALQGLAVDGAGNVYFADSQNNYVDTAFYFEGKNDSVTPLCDLQVGCGLNGPTGVAADLNGNIYIADTGNNRVLEEIYSSGNTYNSAYNYELQAVVAEGLSAPQAVAADSSGNVYIVDTGNNRILKEAPVAGGTFTQTVLFNSGLSAPAGIAIDDFGNIYISDTGNKRVLKETVSGSSFIQTVVPVTGLGAPKALALDAAGDLFIADATNGNVLKLAFGASPSLTFASTAEGSTSSDSPQTVTLENIGTAPLAFAVPSTGSNPSISSSFTLNSMGSTACPLLTSSSSAATLAANATCTLAISFTPAASGTISGSLVLTDNDLNTTAVTQTVSLNGTATEAAAPIASLSPTTLAFGDVQIGSSSAALSTTLSNTGNATLNITGITLNDTTNFTEMTTCGSTLDAGKTCTISVKFTPAAGYPFNAMLSVADDDAGSPQTVSLSGTGTAAPVITETGNLWFNPAPVAIAAASAQTLTATFTLTNFSSVITPTAKMNYGLAYKVGAVTCTGSAGNQTCTVPVTFIPNLPGGHRDALFLMNGTTRLATELAYGVGQSGLSLVQPGTLNQSADQGAYLYASVVADDGTVYILTQSATVLSRSTAGVFTTLPITGLNSPRTIAIDGAGILYIADQTTNGPLTTYDTVLGVQGSIPFPTPSPGVIQTATVNNTGTVYMATYGTIYVFAPGAAQATIAIDPGIDQANAVAVDSANNLFIGGGSVNELTPDGTQTQVNSSFQVGPFYTDAADTLYLTGAGRGVEEFAASDYTTSIGTVDAADSAIGVSVGPDGTAYIGNYGILDEVDRSQQSIDFGSQSVGTAATPQTIQIYNGGNENLTISNIAISGSSAFTTTNPTNPCTKSQVLAPGTLCNLTVGFLSQVPGSFSGSLNFTTNSLNTTSTTSVALAAVIDGVVIASAPASLDFGSVTDGSTSATKTITLTNNGYGDSAQISTPASTDPAFTVTLGTCNVSIPAGGTCALNVTFSPTAVQAYSATGSVAVAGAPTVSFTLTGTGTAAAAPTASLSPTTLSFPSTTVGSTAAALSTTLSNTGNATLNISGITLTGANPTDFAETTTCGSTLAAGKTCTISATFTPATVASYTASISVADNATGSPQTVSLSGTGTGGVTATPTSLNMGSETEYTENYTPQYITLTNNTSSTVTFSNFQSADPSEFNSQAYTCSDGGVLLGNSSCQISVRFSPLSVGVINSSITMPYTGAGGGTLVVQLTGTGTAGTPAIDLYPLPIDFGQLPVMTAGTPITVSLEDPGTAPLTEIGISITGANAGDYTETDTCSGATVDPFPGTAYCSVTVNFTPTAAGPRIATLNLTSNGGTATFSTPLQGAGVAQPAQLQFSPTQLNLVAGAGGACADATAGGLATAATLCNITGSAQDYLGNTYLVDNTYNVVYKVDTTGTISVFAGTPSKTGGYTGDNGPATSATLSGPTAVATDAFGDIYVSDTGNGAIREIDTTGMITSFLDGTCDDTGKGTPMHRATAAKAGKPHPHEVHLCEALQPEGLVVDSLGNLIFADTVNNVVLSVVIATGDFNLVAGDAAELKGTAGYNGDNILANTAELNAPQDVAVDPSGNIYIADTLNYRIRKVTASTGIITTVAGDGTQGDTGDGAAATSATIDAYGVSTDPAGDIFIATGTGGIVRKVDASGNINLFAGGGTGAIGGPASTGAVTNAYFARTDNNGDLLIPTGTQLLAAGPDGLLQFGSDAIGTTTAALNVTLENTGDTPLSLGTTVATVTGTDAADFALTSSTCGYNLQPGKTCVLSVTFDPTATGARTASLSVPTNATGSPQTVLLQGNGSTAAAPAASLSPTSISFPSTAVGSTATAISTTLSNTGNAVLNISGITLTGTNPSDFAIVTSPTACGTTLAAGATCTISATFTPAAAASYTASLSVADNATGSPQTATLSGTGTAAPAPIASLSPTTLTFPATTAGSTATALSTTLSNTGNATLNITGITLTGTNPSDFTITTSGTACGTTLAAGSTCTIAATFTPSAAGSFTATLSVADNATGSPQTATLNGIGNAAPATDFTLTATPPAQTVAPGGTANFTVNTKGIAGAFDSAIQLTATGLPSGYTATFTPSSVTPGANGASSVLSIQTTPLSALTQPGPLHRAPRLPITLAVLLIAPLLGLRKRFRKLTGMRGLMSCLLLFISLAAPVLMLTGCGGGYYSLQTKTYTVTVTGTSGSIQHSTTVTLTVQQ
jgi:sugar lactone lactonase YvrE